MTNPTPVGKRRWPDSDGYLELVGNTYGNLDKIPCSCTEECGEPDCKGSCGCEACMLAWYVYHDDHALWDDEGNLVTPTEIDGPWTHVKNPNLVYQRCTQSRVEKADKSTDH
jgi:hypothetical protein